MIESIQKIAESIRGNRLSKELFNGGHQVVFEHKERIYKITGHSTGFVTVEKFTGLEFEKPELIYDYTAEYSEGRFEQAVRYLNKMHP